MWLLRWWPASCGSTGPQAQAGRAVSKRSEAKASKRADMGTITVRYVITPFDEKSTNLRIDAVFIEDTSRKIHDSDGSVESTALP